MSQSSVKPQPAPPRLHFRVPPEPSHLLRARERLRDYLRQYCAERQVIDDVVLCVQEACTNAIRHGGSPADIEIVVRFTRSRLVATVKDHGRGFDVASFDPRLPPDSGSEHGRGLFIIAALMDSLELRLDGGLEVRMACRAAPRCEPPPLESGLGEQRTGSQLAHREARTRALLEEIDEGFVALDWEYRYVYANDPACRLLAKSRDGLLGHKILTLFPRLRGSELEQGLRAAMDLGRSTTMEWRSPVIDGWVEVRIYPTLAGVTVYFHDIDERKRVEGDRERLIAELRGREEELQVRNDELQAQSEGLQAQSEELRAQSEELVAQHDEEVQRAAAGLERSSDAARFEELLSWSRTTRLVQRLRPHPWRVLAAAVAVQSAILWALNAEDDTRHILGVPGSMIALFAVVAGALAGPLVGAVVALAGGGVFYVTVAGYGARSSVATTLISTTIWLAAGLVSGLLAKGLREQTERRRAGAVALARADAAREAQLAEQAHIEELASGLQLQTDALTERAGLAEALNTINALVHSTLDSGGVLEPALARGVAALHADAGTIELREDESWVVSHQHGFSDDATKLRLSAEQAPIAGRARATRQPVAVADLTLETALDTGFPHAHGLKSVIAVPLIVRQEVIGCLLLWGHRPRVFSRAEIDFARQLGATVSLGVDNARLYLEQRHIAQTLQENFIHELPVVAGLELGVVSKAAAEPELVGGDFSEVFVVDDGCVVVLIGDVAGKGVRAAGMTETVRSTVRALAAADSSPASILARANELLLKFDPDEPHVTAFCAVLDPDSGHVSYASAGHPSPVHLGAFSCRTLDVAFGPPLGSFDHSYLNAHAMLTLEDYLVLYTDGVTESRKGTELFGEQRLLEVVSGLRGRSAQAVAEGLRDAALAFAGRLRDDLQVVVVRLA